MRVFRWLAVSFSLYSRIPMPRFEWNRDDMAQSLAFLPFVGIVIGALVCLINIPDCMKEIPVAARVMLTLLAPLLVTGGFHIDGFMDTEDALRSYAPAEKKLEILKDPHIGAFAVIGLVRCMLIFLCALIIILTDPACGRRMVVILASVFVTGRIFSALTSLMMRKAKPDGMLRKETGGSGRGVMVFLFLQLVFITALTLYLDVLCGAAVLAAFGLRTLYYRHQAYREFGGVTGDTAGHFLVSGEAAACAALAIVMLIRRGG